MSEREAVARVLCGAGENPSDAWAWSRDDGYSENIRSRYLRMADAAIGAMTTREGQLLQLIAQRAQIATADDAEDALTWIYHAARLKDTTVTHCAGSEN